MARQETFAPNLRHDLANSQENVSMVSLVEKVTMSDLVLPDHTGWLTCQSNGRKIWGVVADMLFCIFENQTARKPEEVILLPGCSVMPLVYRTAVKGEVGKDVQNVSKTISGIDKFQIVINDTSRKRKHLFSTETQAELDEWVTILKAASNLDMDIFQQVTETRRNSESSSRSRSPSRGEERRSQSLPRYMPSPQLSKRLDKIDSSCNGKHPVPTIDSIQRMNKKASNDKDQITDFRKRLRRETEPEITKLSPVKAMHFQTISSPPEKVKPKKKLRSFGSLESLFRPRRKSKDRADIAETQSLKDTTSIGSATSLDFGPLYPEVSQHEPKLTKSSSTSRLSRSLDFGKSEKGLSHEIVRRASDLKDRVTKRRGSKGDSSSLKLSELEDVNTSGFLHQKSVLKWHKMWCVVCRGCFYVFKSPLPEETPQVVVVLSGSTVSYVSDPDKRHKKLFMFKISRPNSKSVYLSAQDNMDLTRWLQVLQMAASQIQADGDLNASENRRKSESDVRYSRRKSEAESLKSNNASHSKPENTSNAIDTSKVQYSDRESIDSSHSVFSYNSRKFASSSWCGTTSTSDYGDFDNPASSTDDWDNSSSVSSQADTGFVGSCEDLPTHDPTLTQVWQKDRGYLFNVIRAKLKAYRKRREDIYDKDLPGPNNEGLLLLQEKEKHRSSRKRSQGSSRDVRRSKSFNADRTGTKMDATPAKASTPTLLKKRHKPLTVRRVSARELEDHTIAGHVERKSFSGQWIRYWYVLKGGSLFCYLTQDDNVTVDILDLKGYFITSHVDKYRGKRFVLQLTHEEYTSVYLSVDSREEMCDWLECLEAATGQPPSGHSAEPEDADGCEGGATSQPVDEHVEKRQAVKQKLLEEMLRQKHELEKKQAARQKKHQKDTEEENIPHSYNSQHSTEEQRLCDVTRLKQRRMSAQLKMEVIQKQMHTSNGHKKSLFKFGHRKKSKENKSELLQEQLQELSNRVYKIDKDLNSCENIKKDDVFDQNQNKTSPTQCFYADDLRRSLEAVTLGGTPQSPNIQDVQRTSSLKSSVQKLAHRTFAKSSWNRGKKSNNSNSLPNGDLMNLHSSDSDFMRGFDDDDEYNSVYGIGELSSESLTDLTKSNTQPRRDELKLDLSFANGADSSSSKPVGRQNGHIVTSPRREINPCVLAEIEAFEELTRQVLNARSDHVTP